MKPKWIKGKTVDRIEMNTWIDKEGPYTQTRHDPVIYFTDGSSVAFNAEETFNGGSYGVKPIYRKPMRSNIGHPRT